MNFYPHDLRVMIAYIEALDAAEKAIEGIKDAPYPKRIEMVDSGGDMSMGYLSDEIGGAWSWTPPERPA